MHTIRTLAGKTVAERESGEEAIRVALFNAPRLGTLEIVDAAGNVLARAEPGR